MKKNDGFTSFEFLISLIFISLILIAFSILVQTVNITVNKKTNKGNDKKEIDLIISEIIDEIKNDRTPEVDSKNDPIWNLNENNKNGYKITIKSLSGFVDLNFLDSEILLQTSIGTLIDNSELITYLENFKNENKLFINYEQIKDYISEDTFNKYFTFYSFPNINIVDSKSLETLINNLTSSSIGADLVNKQKILKFNKQYIQTETDYNLFAGINYDKLIPYINIKPTLNINFIDESLLRGLLSYSKFEVSGINQKVNTIISLRETSEIKENDICNILGISKADELYYYLGCKTWLWEINIESNQEEKSSCRCIIARSFEENSLGSSDYYIIEKKWL